MMNISLLILNIKQKNQGHDIDKITQDVKNQYQEQKKKLSKKNKNN